MRYWYNVFLHSYGTIFCVIGTVYSCNPLELYLCIISTKYSCTSKELNLCIIRTMCSCTPRELYLCVQFTPDLIHRACEWQLWWISGRRPQAVTVSEPTSAHHDRREPEDLVRCQGCIKGLGPMYVHYS